MKTERLKILQMLEDGKVSADEAAKLLEAIKGAGYEDYHEHWRERFWDEDSQKHWEEKLNKFNQNIESFSKEIGSRLEVAWKEVEPKFRAASKTIVEKTAVIIDDISKSLSETLRNMEQCDKECDKESDKSCCDPASSCDIGPAEENPASDDKPIEN